MEETFESQDESAKVISYLQRCGHKRNPFVLKGEEVVIGRNPRADLVIPSSNVSRVHAVFKNGGNNLWQIKDNRSLNGVYVNETKLPPGEWHPLKSGVVVHLGPPTETEYSIQFVQKARKPVEEEHLTQPRPSKIPKPDSSQQSFEERLELERKLKELEEQLKNKERVEMELQKKLTEQQEENARERERLLRERETEETRLRSNLEQMLEAKERLLKEALDSQREEQEKKQDVASKAEEVSRELAEVQRLRERAKADVLGHFADLLETEFTCSICSELFVEAVTLSCSHTFCKLCIDTWKRKKKSCPICRTKIKGKGETRSLAIDNFIEGMITQEMVEQQVATRRKEVLLERSAANNNKLQQPRPQAHQPQGIPANATGNVIWQQGTIPSALLMPGGQRFPPATSTTPPTFLATSTTARHPYSLLLHQGFRLLAPQTTHVRTAALPMQQRPRYPIFVRAAAPRQTGPTTNAMAVVPQQAATVLPSTSSATDEQSRPTIVISDDEDQSAGTNLGAYYGGYGTCFKCHRGGHWANGCPFDVRGEAI